MPGVLFDRYAYFFCPPFFSFFISPVFPLPMFMNYQDYFVLSILCIWSIFILVFRYHLDSSLAFLFRPSFLSMVCPSCTIPHGPFRGWSWW